jgi:hypothetical protein
MTSANPPFTVTARPSTVTPEERRRRLALVYELLAQAAARAENGRQAGEVVKHGHILP